MQKSSHWREALAGGEDGSILTPRSTRGEGVWSLSNGEPGDFYTDSDGARDDISVYSAALCFLSRRRCWLGTKISTTSNTSRQEVAYRLQRAGIGSQAVLWHRETLWLTSNGYARVSSQLVHEARPHWHLTVRRDSSSSILRLHSTMPKRPNMQKSHHSGAVQTRNGDRSCG